MCVCELDLLLAQFPKPYQSFSLMNNYSLTLGHGGTSWEEKALLGAGWGSGAHTQGEGEELVDSDIRGSTLAEKARRTLFNVLHTRALLLLHLVPVLLIDFLLHIDLLLTR